MRGFWFVFTCVNPYGGVYTPYVVKMNIYTDFKSKYKLENIWENQDEKLSTLNSTVKLVRDHKPI